MPTFQKYFRLCQDAKNPLAKQFLRFIYRITANKNHIEISSKANIGYGLYIGHPFCITVNDRAIIGNNCNVHKGITIGQENRGPRRGVPTIGNNVWIGINSTIVGNIHVGNDVLIAPNTFVNRDIPDHSVVFGNPCIVKHKEYATEDYINNEVEQC
ncbi:MAG: serine acetyltransferase [Clostridia bacterium]|nr:serine acetyltransferase [Clostridia bacterium]